MSAHRGVRSSDDFPCGAQKSSRSTDRLLQTATKMSLVLGANFRCLHPALGFGFRLERAVVDHSGRRAGGLAIYNRALLGCGVADNIEVSERRLRESGDRKKSQSTGQDRLLHFRFPPMLVVCARPRFFWLERRFTWQSASACE